MKTYNLLKRFWWTIWLLPFVIGMNQLANAQTLPTPTPNANGEILVEVQPNDTLWEIAARYGLTLDDLLQLNNLTEESFVQPGQLLLIGLATPTPTLTPVPPTLTSSPTLPPPPTGTAVVRPPTGLCITAYDDINGDGILQPGEPLLADVAFTVFTEQIVILNYITDGFSEPTCFENIASGTYQITRSVNDQERLTTPGNRGVFIQDGTVANLQFGSTLNTELEITSDFTNQPEIPTVLPLSAAIDQEQEGVQNGRFGNESDRSSQQPFLIVMSLLGMLLVGAVFFIIMRLNQGKFEKTTRP
ncbi:MAG: LysM domain-containing protein [Chloroflexota bacterium]